MQTTSAECEGMPIDWQALERLAAEIGPSHMAIAFAAFGAELVRRHERTGVAARAGDAGQLAREAHSIKGSARTFGARLLETAALRVLDAHRRGDEAGALAASDALVAALDTTAGAARALVPLVAELR